MEVFFTSTFLLLALATISITQIITMIVGLMYSDVKLYKDKIAPTLPLVIGGICSYIMTGDCIVGLVAGLLSGFVFRYVKELFKSKLS